MSAQARGALFLAVMIVFGCAYLLTGKKDVPVATAPLPTISEAPPVLSAPPLDAVAPSPTFEKVGAPDAGEVTVRPPSQRLGPDELVRALVGRWRSEDGIGVEVEPPRDADHKTPPYRLVFRGPGLPRSGYGCEFALLDSEHRPKGSDSRGADGATQFYSAWCSKGTRSVVALTLDVGLAVAVLSSGRVVHQANALSRVEGDRKTQ